MPKASDTATALLEVAGQGPMLNLNQLPLDLASLTWSGVSYQRFISSASQTRLNKDLKAPPRKSEVLATSRLAMAS